MWLKTRIGKRVRVRSTRAEVTWEGALVDVDSVGLIVNDAEAGPTFIPFNSVFAVHVLER
ncbi:MAG: hypothetical protein LUP95_01680 [Euryarchaeota archaeon]|nr:hypothetical protein [Euryarchaeota archaeon]